MNGGKHSPATSSGAAETDCCSAAADFHEDYDRRPSQLVLDFRSNHHRHRHRQHHSHCQTAKHSEGASEDSLKESYNTTSTPHLSTSAPSNSGFLMSSSCTASMSKKLGGGSGGASGIPSASIGEGRSSLLKSITASSVASGRHLLSLDMDPAALGEVLAIQGEEETCVMVGNKKRSSSMLQGIGSGSFVEALEEFPSRLPLLGSLHVSQDTREIAVQTDVWDADSEKAPVDQQDAQFVKREYEEPFDEDASDPDMDPIRWIIGLDVPGDHTRYRPTAPDAEMMTVGRRLGFVDDSPVGGGGAFSSDEDTLVDDGTDSVLGDDLDSPDQNDPFASAAAVVKVSESPPSPRSNHTSSFSLVPPSDSLRPIWKPKSMRPVPPYIVDMMNPTSPPSSEFTVPSETGSESSYSTTLSLRSFLSGHSSAFSPATAANHPHHSHHSFAHHLGNHQSHLHPSLLHSSKEQKEQQPHRGQHPLHFTSSSLQRPHHKQLPQQPSFHSQRTLFPSHPLQFTMTPMPRTSASKSVNADKSGDGSRSSAAMTMQPGRNGATASRGGYF